MVVPKYRVKAIDPDSKREVFITLKPETRAVALRMARNFQRRESKLHKRFRNTRVRIVRVR